MNKGKASLNLEALQPAGMFLLLAATMWTSLSPLQFAVLALGIAACFALIVAATTGRHGRPVSIIAGFVAVMMFLTLAGTLGNAIGWLQVAIVVLGVAGIARTVWQATSGDDPRVSASEL